MRLFECLLKGVFPGNSLRYLVKSKRFEGGNRDTDFDDQFSLFRKLDGRDGDVYGRLDDPEPVLGYRQSNEWGSGSDQDDRLAMISTLNREERSDKRVGSRASDALILEFGVSWPAVRCAAI